MRNLFVTIILLLVSAGPINSQSILDWTAYTSFRTVNDILQDENDNAYLATEGGIAIYQDTVLIKTLTVIDGLSRLNSRSIEYDPVSKSLFVGYVDGMIDMIDIETFEIRKIDDIARNSVFSSRSVNKVLANEELLFVATDFGIVEYDINSLLVRNSYLKLGSFDRGLGINDIKIIENKLYVATNEGIAYSELDGNFQESDWENFDQSSGLGTGAITTIGFFNDVLVASSIDENYKFENGNWVVNPIFNDNVIIDYQPKGSKTVALSEKNLFIEENSTINIIFLSGVNGTSLSSSNSDEVLFGTLNDGIGTTNSIENSFELITPEGPYQNYFQGISFDDGTLISSSSQKSAQNFSIDKGKGFYIFDGSNWNNVNAYNNQELNQTGYRLSFTSLATDDYFYFGSWGQGISRFEKDTEEVTVFNETNTTIRGWSGAALDYPVMIGLEQDSKGNVWTVSRFAEIPLYRQTPGDNDWQPFDKINSINSSDLYEGLFIDSFDLKWIPLQNELTSGTGLLIIDSKDPENENDDVGIKLTTDSNGGNLPDNKVKAIIEDKNGEVWIGTERGIAKFIFPELIINGSIQEKTAQWLVNEDTTALSRFLLRDINVSSMAVNSANEKWIGSTNEGVWLLNEEGSKIIEHFNTENSPLFSDNIISIAVNDVTGEVFIATDLGLISYQDVPKKSVSKMKELKVFPNPFNYEENDQIFIEGLSDATEIKILGVDGTVVHTFETQSGRVSWDGKSRNGAELGSGVYFIVAVDKTGISKGVGKVIIVQ
ncbi:MAG: two-component regulator propeller domain-containing protein [Balneola sp.]